MLPIFRWAIGACHNDGVDVLVESLKFTTATLGRENFDWRVYHNDLKYSQYSKLRKVCKNFNISFIDKDLTALPIPIDKPETFLKFCPARANIDVHEIFCDNDIVIYKPIKKIFQFLKNEVLLLSEDQNHFYGQLTNTVLDFTLEKINTGFIGLPPGFDLQKEMLKTWKFLGSPSEVPYYEEQGFVALTLLKHPHVFVKDDDIQLLLNNKTLDYFDKSANGYHYCRTNVGESIFWNSRIKKVF